MAIAILHHLFPLSGITCHFSGTWISVQNGICSDLIRHPCNQDVDLSCITLEYYAQRHTFATSLKYIMCDQQVDSSCSPDCRSTAKSVNGIVILVWARVGRAGNALRCHFEDQWGRKNRISSRICMPSTYTQNVFTTFDVIEIRLTLVSGDGLRFRVLKLVLWKFHSSSGRSDHCLVSYRHVYVRITVVKRNLCLFGDMEHPVASTMR